MASSALESKFLLLWRVAQGPPLEREYRFHPTRKWRADFSHPESRTLIEIEGGIFMRKGGRHNRGIGYAKDAEKYLEAAMEGWTVLRLTEKQLEIEFIERIVAWINYLPMEETIVNNPEEDILTQNEASKPAGIDGLPKVQRDRPHKIGGI